MQGIPDKVFILFLHHVSASLITSIPVVCAISLTELTARCRGRGVGSDAKNKKSDLVEMILEYDFDMDRRPHRWVQHDRA